MYTITTINELPVMMLAYYGDAVMELLVREKLLTSGVANIGAANRMSKNYVTLEAQSDAFSRVEDKLTDWEASVYRRARNHSSRTPSHGSAAQYHRSTGFEAVFGALWLAGEEARARELFAAAYPPDNPDPPKEPKPPDDLEPPTGKEADIGEA